MIGEEGKIISGPPRMPGYEIQAGGREVRLTRHIVVFAVVASGSVIGVPLLLYVSAGPFGLLLEASSGIGLGGATVWAVLVPAVKTGIWITPYRVLPGLDPQRVIPYVWGWELVFFVINFIGWMEIDSTYDPTPWVQILFRFLAWHMLPAAIFHWYFKGRAGDDGRALTRAKRRA